MIAEAIQAALLAQPFITSRLGVFDFGDDGEKPAVFPRDPAPVDSTGTVITIDVPGGGTNDHTRGKKSAEITGSVTVWGEKDGSELLIQRLAFDVWRVLDRGQLTLDDDHWKFVGAQATAPSKRNDPDGFPGFEVSFSIRIEEKES